MSSRSLILVIGISVGGVTRKQITVFPTYLSMNLSVIFSPSIKKLRYNNDRKQNGRGAFW